MNSQPNLYRQSKPSLIGGDFIRARDAVYDFQRNHLIVSDMILHRLYWLDGLNLRYLCSYGNKIGTALGQFYNPTGLCLQPITNHLLVCDTDNHRVQVLSLENDIRSLYAIGKKPVFSIFQTVEGSKKKGEFQQPLGVCCSPDGGIFISDRRNHRVQIFDAMGRFVSTFENENLDSPETVCFVHPRFSPSSMTSGMFCVGNSNGNILQCYSSPLSSFPQHLFTFRLSSANINKLCVDLKGYLHASRSWPDYTISIFDFRMVRSCTTVRSSVDEPALIQTLGKNDRQFCEPYGMCVDNNNTLFVMDYDHHQIQMFEEMK